MFRSLVRNTLWYSVATLLSRGMGLILLPFYARVLGPEAYGQVDYLYALAAVLVVLIGLENNQGMARYQAEQSDPADMSRFVSTAALTDAGLYAIGGAICLALVPASLAFLPEGSTVAMAASAVLYVCIWGVSRPFMVQLQFTGRAREAVLAGAIGAVATAAATVPAVVVWRLGVVGVMLGYSVGAAANAVACWAFSRDAYRWTWDAAAARRMLRFGIPLVPASLGVLAMLYIDRIVINAILGVDELGVYGVALRIAGGAAVLLGPIELSVTPLIYLHHEEAGAAQDIRRFGRLVLVGGAAMSCGLVIWGAEVVAVMAGEAFEGGGGLVGIVFGGVILSKLQLFAPGLRLGKRTSVVAAINVGAALMNLGLNIVMVRAFGLIGAAVATVASAMFVYLANEAAGRRYFAVSIGHGWLVGAVGLVTAVALAMAPVDSQPWMGLGWKVLASVVVAGVALPPLLRLARPGTRPVAAS